MLEKTIREDCTSFLIIDHFKYIEKNETKLYETKETFRLIKPIYSNFCLSPLTMLGNTGSLDNNCLFEQI